MSSRFSLFGGTLLLAFGTGLLSVLVPLRARGEGFSDHGIGLLGMGFYLGFVLGTLLVPRLVLRVGPRLCFALLAAAAGQILPLHAVLGQLAAWIGLRMALGFCLAGLFMVVESWLNQDATSRGSVMAIYMMISAVASAAGQSVLQLTGSQGLSPFLTVGTAIALSMLPLALCRQPLPPAPASPRLDLRRLYVNSPLALLGCLWIGLANGAFWGLAPLALLAGGQSPVDISRFMAAALLGGALGQWPAGSLSDRYGRRGPLLVGSGLAVLFALALLMPAAWPWRLGLAALFGAAAFPLYALLLAHANDHAGPGRAVETSGGLLLAFGLGAAAGAPLASLMPSAGGVFAFTAAVHAGLVATILWRLKVSPAPLPAVCRSAPAPGPGQWAVR